MRFLPFIISTIITLALIVLLNNKWGSIPPLGRFLSPQQGFWQNADPCDRDYSENLAFSNLKGKVDVYFDERLVPHIFAEEDLDAYFVQGFLHAKFRLWQMEFQTIAASGRISEVLGDNPGFLRFDREQRRLGMVYGAKNTLAEMEKHPETKKVADAYTAGVNAYINNLSESELPIEYKLLDYKPEPWSNLKIALFLKAMSKDLAGGESDIAYTNAKTIFGADKMKLLFPQAPDSLVPIIPSGTQFDAPGIVPVQPANADSLYFEKDTIIQAVEIHKPDPNNGSNNWAVNGTKTKSGSPILCNDPHLGLSFPSVWYEMQIHTPTMNAYGATFPGSPNIIIGFNEDVAFGFTNAQRDVKDYYQIRFRDASKKEYWYNGKWEKSRIEIETFKRRGAADFMDTVAYTVFGPVMYDESFTFDSSKNTALAVRWTAHEPSDELGMWVKLNRAKNYSDYEEAIKTYVCPGQNMLFASKTGDIALWQQALFPARWEGQGLFIMPGEDSSYQWQGFIPQQENPHVINPPSGYIQSANQRPVDTTYPYFIPGNYINARGMVLQKMLDTMQGITPQDMMRLQNDYYSINASIAVPMLLKHLNISELDGKEREYLDEIRGWNFYTTPDSRATTIYQTWLDSLEVQVWRDEFSRIPVFNKIPALTKIPEEQTLIEALLRDSAFVYADDISTPQVESVAHQVTNAFHRASAALSIEEKDNNLLWWKHKRPYIRHLLRDAVKPFYRSDLQVGGWSNTINAITDNHGPSWRMIVHLTTPIEAYGIYPGGQSGNAGSCFYDSFVDKWAKGEYYRLWFMTAAEANDKRVQWKMTFTNS